MTSSDIEIAVANHFNFRQNVVVPNIHWGMGLLYEADVVVLRPSDYGIEVEIKVSSADIKADLKKSIQHNSNLFRELWFAVPDSLASNPDIPERAGILSVSEVNGLHKVKAIRRPVRNVDAKKWTIGQRINLLRLASMRTWTLKQTIQKLRPDTPRNRCTKRGGRES